MTDLTIIIDTREQHPFLFDEFDVATVRQTMTSGDYGVVSLPGIAIERKSGPDLYGCMAGGRDRFQRELERLREFEFSAVVCEDLESMLLSGCYGRMSPRSIKATLVAWQTRFPTQWVFCPSRRWAERTTFMLLERFWRDVRDDKRPSPVREAATV
ncbi:MAG: ERCC4 domain-containing protein [Planctomycetes bacterium]|nr:ERCC4 domain-containing protein [Planctomycetota bacterium]